MTTTFTAPAVTQRAVKGVGMKLISLDSQFDGTILDVLEYRNDSAGRVEVTALVESPGAWYSGTYPVVLAAAGVRLLLTVQSMPRQTTGAC